MAPKNEKAEKAAKASAEDGSAMILEYLRKQNRPYSAVDISANLHNKVTKAYTAKTLKEMHEKKLLEGRAAGKQLVYHAIQDPADEATPEELAGIDQEIENLKGKITSTKAKEKELKAELATLTARVPTSELRDQVHSLRAMKQETLANLAPLRNGNRKVRMVSVDEQRRVEGEWRKWKRSAAVRRTICRDLWEKCTEVLPEDVDSKEELWESLGLEGRF